MKYSKALFEFQGAADFVPDVLTAQLAELGFESFENPTPDQLVAYVQTDVFNPQDLQQMLQTFPYAGVCYKGAQACEDKNWNEEWEKHYFEPIVLGNECVIHSSFHKDLPVAKYDIVIDPKMAFGTGHHQTTSLMIENLLRMDLQNRSFLDMGCGTAVLAILATLRGAKPVTAIDIDNWCVENAAQNCALNRIDDMEILLGDAKTLAGRHFDVILANINRNILLMDMAAYATCLPVGGELLISGFYTEDIPLLEAKAQTLRLHKVAQYEKEHWACVHFVRA